jgi:hypothetical protein
MANLVKIVVIGSFGAGMSVAGLLHVLKLKQ